MSTEDKLTAHMERVAAELRRRAKHGIWNGVADAMGWKYMKHCTRDDGATRTRLIFTRDTGHHSSGWLKNPDYERCWHLSTSPHPDLVVIPGRELAEPDPRTMRRWVEVFFGAALLPHVWAESPKTPEGRARGVWHWRVFCDEHWTPITPRKEVYSRDFTPADWRTASQVLAEDGYFRSEREDGTIIESTVDPT